MLPHLFSRFKTAPRFLRFCFAGGVGFLVDALLLLALIHFGFDKIGARLFSAIVSLHTTWLLNRYFTYPQQHAISWGEWARYLSVNGAGFMINLAVYAFSVAALKYHFLSAIIISSAVALIFNYFANLHLVFAERERAPLLPKKVLPAFLIMTALVLLIGLQQWMQWDQSKGIQADSVDSWLRLHIVENLYETGNWYDHDIERANSPHGMTSPWTRPLDVLLLAGAYILSQFMTFKAALLLWAAVWGRLLYLACGAVLLKMAWRVDASRRSFLFVAIVTVLNPVAWSYFAPGNADHHSLLITLFTLACYQAYRLAEKPQDSSPAILGVICGLGIWVSLEFLVPTVLFIGWLGAAWCQRSVPARLLVRMSDALLFMLVVGLLIERRPEEYFLTQYDTLSILHIALAAGIFAASLVLRLLENAQRSTAIRWLASLMLTLLLAFVLQLFFPDFIGGPLIGVSAEMRNEFLNGVLEMQPLSHTYPAYFAVCVIFGILPLPLLLKAFFSGGNKLTLGLVLLLDIAFTLMVMLGVRWGGYAIITQAIACMFAIAYISGKWPQAQRYLSPIMLVLVLGGFIALNLDGTEKTKPTGDLAGMSNCEIELKKKIIRGDFSGAKSLTISAPADLGSYLLFWTPHRIVASNYHRDEQGFLDQLHFYQSADENKAKRFVDVRDIDKIILCTTPREQKRFPLLRWLGKKDAALPDWLQRNESESDPQNALYVFDVMR